MDPITPHNPTPLLEVAVFSYHGALLAEQAGADRIELCENPLEGGTTPSYGYLQQVSQTLTIPVFPIIRPRGGDFLYSDEEWKIVLQDIRVCKEMGFSGIVTGCLTPAATIHESRLRLAVETAYPMQVTFHRAFDRVQHPLAAIEQLIACGCTRLLTSGGKPTAPDGIELIRQLVQQAADRITIMPGSGVRSNNIAQLQQTTGAREFHSSARRQAPSEMQFITPDFADDGGITLVDVQEIRRMKSILLEENKMS